MPEMPSEASEPPDQPQSDAKPPEGKERKKRKTYQQVQMPSPEQIMQEDFMNHCVVRTILSGVMGMGLGAVFGIAMGTFDTAARPFTQLFKDTPSHCGLGSEYVWHASTAEGQILQS